MSESGDDNRGLLTAEEIEAQAVAWFVDQNEPAEWTKERHEELEAWLSSSPRHLLAYWRVQAGWDHAGLLAAVHQLRDLRDDTGVPRAARGRWEWPWFRAISAVAAVLIVCIVATFQLRGRDTITYSTAVGGSKTISLSDGSRIELNTDSVVRVSTGGKNREIELVRGEAYFRVRHDPSRPLIVTFGGERLVDLGTEFLVRKATKRTEVGVVEGSVRLEESGFLFASPVATLAPGDLAVETADKVIIRQGATRDLADALAWRTGMLVFRHATLATAAAEFNRYNQEKVIVVDGAENLVFSSVFPVHGVEAFARVAQKSLGLHVERRAKDIVIAR